MDLREMSYKDGCKMDEIGSKHVIPVNETTGVIFILIDVT
jgi:hypothetical protein